jgi:hypothetical protein
MGSKNRQQLFHLSRNYRILAKGKPSPRVPLNPSACARTMVLLAKRSTIYLLPWIISSVMFLFPSQICCFNCSSSSFASNIAYVTSFATVRIFWASWLSILTLPL